MKILSDSNVAAPLPEEINRLVGLFHQGRFIEGETLARSLTLRFPDHDFGWKVLGALLKQQGRLEEAVSAMRQAVILQPNDYAAQSNLGLGFMSVGRFADAEISYRNALAVKEDLAEVHNNLGVSLKEQGRFSDSEAAYRRALELTPDYAEAFFNLGNILQAQGRSSEAEMSYRQALHLNPDNAEVYNNLGINLQKQGQLSEAETCFQKALKIRPDYVEAYSNLGITLQDQGRFPESEAHYRHALDLKPDYANAHSNLLFLMNYHPDKSAEEIYEEYRLFNARFGEPLHQEWQPHPNNRESNRRLKVGYVSGDFNLHPVRHFLKPLLAHHDKAAVEVYAYAEVAVEDAMTTRYRDYVDHWIATAGMSDTELTARIRSDAIDILVELSGHTAKNRLGVFARKPAPVSLSWLGYGYTTGLTAIDYFLTDLTIVPLGSEGLFSETPWQLVTPSCAYRPAEDMGEVGPLPAQELGYISFGTLSRAVRINHRTIRVWAEILQRVPGSHLVVNSSNFKDPAMQSKLAAKFEAHGIDRARLEIGCSSPPWDVLRGLDIGLDCFPHNSGTTLFEHLYMGVPFVTLAGRPSVGRLGACILEGVGHPEWIAATEDEYVERAVALASDLPRLASLRANLRGEMESGPLRDEPAFTRKVEAAYREMFVKWCEGELAVDNQEQQMIGENTIQPFEEMLQQAIAHHQSGQLQEAERLYLRLLQIHPDHPLLNFNLGLLAVQMEQPAAGLPYFEAALDADPEKGAYWLHYIDALTLAGRIESACQILEIAKQSGLQGEEVDALSARLTVLSEEKPTVKTFPKKEGLEEKDSKKKGKKAKSAKAPGGRPGGAEPGADEIKRLVTSFTQSRYEEAEALARTMIMRYPRHGYAWKVLGAIFRQQGLLAEALSAMSQALAFLPTDYISMKNIAVILCDLGRYAEAEDYCHKALALNPDYAEVHNTLSIVFRSLNRQSESEESCNRALTLKPGYADAYVNLGILLYDQGRIGESKNRYLKALELSPNSSGAYCGLGLAQKALGEITEAEASCRRAIALKPNFPEAYNSLGSILYEQGRYGEAELAYHVAVKLKQPYVEALHNLARTLQKQKKFAAAESIYNQVVEFNPDNAVACYDLGSSFEEQGKYSEAESSYEKAVELRPDYIEAWVNLGNASRKQGGLIKAEKSYRKALLINHDYVGATNNLGYILQEQGRLAESEVITRTILQSYPDYTEAFSNLLFLMNYHPDKGAEEIYEEYRLFNTRFGQPLHQEWQPHPNSRELNRRLKVGYVSGDFNLHPVRHFLEPLLAHHDKTAVEIYAYSEVAVEDAMTARYRGYADHWVATAGMSDIALATRIRSDSIDILVDLSGHTAKNRLGVFAHKPAPVSVSWLGYGYTTGLTSIDYFLTDLAIAPPGSEGFFSETPWRLATPSCAYRPAEGMGEVSALPARERGYITFGTLTRAVRTNHRTIRVWAEILHRVPGSHLVINSGSFKDPAMQNMLFDKFVAYGIDRDRLEIGCNSPPWDVLRGLDIGLDCFPHNSGTTLFENLYMGIPFVTLAGRPSVGRLGACILEGVGHPEWIAWTEDEYVECAVALSSDLSQLESLRRGLRAEMEAGSLMDEPTFARKVEAAYQGMFAKWCEESAAKSESAEQGFKRDDLTTKGKKWRAEKVPGDMQGGAEPTADEVNRLVTSLAQGRIEEAETLTRSMTMRFPQHGFAWKVLVSILQQQGRATEAFAAMQQAVVLLPDDYDIHYNLGIAFQDQGRFLEAEARYRRVLELHPEYTEAHNNLGNTLKELGRLAEAETSYLQALKYKPDFAEVYNNLGINFHIQGRLGEAEECYRKASIIRSDFVEAQSNLGSILSFQGRFSEAEKNFRQALHLNPDNAEVYNNLGINLQKQGQLSEAETCFQKALKIRPDYAEAYSNLGITLQDQGRFPESEAHYRHALDLEPDYANAHSNLLFLMNYHPDKNAEEIYAEYRLFNARFEQPLHQDWQPHPNSRESNRRLKVGYVSGDFNLHPVRHFLEPLLAHHDKAAVEVYAYAEVAVEDAMTTRYRDYVDHWIATAGMSDTELTARIRSDAIDILVELSGHTAKNRLGVFARKPAPVSLSWLGYGYTTGLTAIDYFLTDLTIVPLGSEGLFSETPWRLTTPSCVYRPAEGMGEVSALPARERGYITFGTLTRAVRINHRTIRVWAEILQRVPGSHLVVNSSNFKDPAMQSKLAAKFEAHGIDRARLEIGCSSPPWDVLRGLDIGLDCFPHNSGTTLFEHLYMGVPFVTLAGRPSVGRLGACILEGVGHPEWIAATEDEYVERAVALASDLPRLASLRAGLRAEMKSGPLQDEPAFVRKVEGAYRQMFAKWCEGGSVVSNQGEQMSGQHTSLPFDEQLQRAVAHHQSGQLQEAERLYLTLLQAQPDHSILNYNLGLLAVQMQQPDAGLPYFEAALDANPEDGAYWLSYIDALAQAGRPESACQILEIAKQSGLQGAEVDALSARLAVLPGNTSVEQSDPAEKERTRDNTKRNSRQTRSNKASGGRQRASEPRADEIERLAATFTQGRYEEAETLARSMARRFPGHGFAWKVLGPILKQQGLAVEALSAMQQAVVLLPHDYGTHYNLGISYQDQGKFEEAEVCYRRALELNPKYVEAYNNLGNTLNALGKIAEAESSLCLAIKLKPGFAEAYNDLGNLLKGQGRLMEAKEQYRLALKLKPDFVIAYSNLGNILKDQGGLVDAEDCYRNALKLKPDFAEVHYNLGNTLRILGSLAESETCFRRALDINPNFTEAHNNLGVCLKEQGLIEEAEKSYNHALQLNPNYAEAYSNLGSIFNIKGRFFEAEKSFRSALELKPDYENAISNLLFLMNYHPDKSNEEIYEEYKRYNDRFGLPLQKDWRPHANRKEKHRRLKVGYVSGDYNKHSVRHFLEPLFAHHNKEAVELYAYAEIMVEDTVTARYKEKADHWIPTVGMTDTELAERIRSDAIDVLVELSGHTAKHRLGVFARKPAPVSVSWMGYGYTTGLTAIDYFLTDATIVPEGSEGLFAETPWRLTTPSCAYRPAEGMGEVSPLPARQRGYVTFGTLTRAVRVNHLTIRVWSEILKRVPGSHLVINSGNFQDSKMRSLMLEKFTAQGIEEERLEIGCSSPPWDVLRAMDIGLDCFPHNSGTTLFENLYMGVPFVTLAGRPSAGRLGACILEGVGHGEWIAWSEEEYIERAVSLAMDLPHLEKLRAGLRGEMESGPLMDEAGFVRKVEAAYEEMFGKWCEGKR